MTAAAQAPPHAEERSLAHLPVGAFAMVMGVAGLAVAWQKAGELWGFGPIVGRSLAVLALGLFVVVATGYAIKAIRFWPQLVAEWTHPVTSAFAATLSISLMVLAVAFTGWLAGLSSGLWWTGAALQAAITLWVVRTWIADAAVQQLHVHPAWFIPAVGNLIAPIAGAGLAPAVLNWYFFGVGAVYYLALLPIVLGRLFTAAPLPPRLLPTLAILIAPPAVASLAWVRLGGGWDNAVVKVLLGLAVFQLLLLAIQAVDLRSVPFAISSWAYSFPLAALSTALIGSTLGGGIGYGWFAAVVLASSTIVVVGLLWLTIRAISRGEICRPE